jgi:hypothetical protein
MTHCECALSVTTKMPCNWQICAPCSLPTGWYARVSVSRSYVPALTDEQLAEDPEDHRSGYVAVIGKPNAGEHCMAVKVCPSLQCTAPVILHS